MAVVHPFTILIMLLQIVLDMGEDRQAAGPAASFTAFNPVANDEIAIATQRRNMLISRNKGKDWIQIAYEGDING